MRILGIDPGYAIVGWGVLDSRPGAFELKGFGAILTEADLPFPKRLAIIAADMEELLDKYQPDCLAIEKLYFNTNTTTAIDVAQARGVIVAACAKRNIPVSEYTPSQVKQSVVGYGKAEKAQVMEMVRKLLKLEKVPRPDDTADALALAITHSHVATGAVFSVGLKERKGI